MISIKNPMEKIPFYFFYTPNYIFWYNHLTETLNNIFNVNPIEIEKIILSNANLTGHHFTNVTIKVELVIDSIKKNMNKYIIFSDATIFVNKEKLPELETFITENISKNKDIIFAYLPQDPINIGFMLIKCNEKTLFFWEEILKIMQNNLNCWDQWLVNKLILDPAYKIDYDFFDNNKVWVGDLIPKENLGSFFIYKSTLNPRSDRQKVRLGYLLESSLIDKKTHDFYLKNN
jgi:hypothetical protein